MFKRILLASALLAATPSLAVVNGGFQSGLTGWSSVGTTGTAATYGSFSAISSNRLGFVQAGLGAGVSSTLSQIINLCAGCTVKGFVGFQANDYLPFNDFASLTVGSTTVFSSSVAAVGDYGNSGWVPFSYTSTTGGTYTLTLAVANAVDNSLSSGAVLDGVMANVPEPATWSMLIVGFGLVGLARRRRSVVAA